MDNNKKTALRLIFLFGLISLFGDIVYEGARSVNGPYLKLLGANAAIVGFVAGFAEFLGYAIRIASGYFADKSKAYWLFTILGYGMLATVPLLSLTGVWQYAALFMILERLGKGVRSPAKDTIISQATKQVGTGFGFAIVEVLDQIGAAVGPLVFVFLFLSLGTTATVSDYQRGYSLYWIPFGLLMVTLLSTSWLVRDPAKLELAATKKKEPDHLSRTFWLYCYFIFLTTFGFANFALIGYHLKTHNLLSDAQIPLVYAGAMAVDAVAALIIGTMYDRIKMRHNNDKSGLLLLIAMPVLTATIPILAFSRDMRMILTSIVIWGIVMGTHETIMKAAIADITSLKKRGTGYGIFNTFYGLSLFIGSAVAGYLYDYSLPLLIGVVIVIEILSFPVFLAMKKTVVAN